MVKRYCQDFFCYTGTMLRAEAKVAKNKSGIFYYRIVLIAVIFPVYTINNGLFWGFAHC